MSTNRLYDAWINWLQQVRPLERVTRVRGVAACIAGMYAIRSVHLSHIASEIAGDAVVLSQERRMRRLLDNKAIVPKLWYAPIARWWLQWVGQTQQEIVLLIDSSKVSAHHQLLMVALALPNRRCIPIAWTWVACKKGYSTRTKQLALLARVQGLLPASASAPARVPVILVGDTEFGTIAVIQQVSEQWGWHYALRQKGVTLVECPRTPASAEPASAEPVLDWQHFSQLVSKPGQWRFVSTAKLTQRHAYPTSLLAVWEKGEREPWLLATDLTSLSDVMRAYGQRMLIEQMFGDFKRHGVDLEATRLTHIQRLNRLTLMVCLLYVCLLRMGLALLIARKARQVDRSDRRDLSIFQLGWRFLKRLLVNNRELRVTLCPDSLLDLWPGN